MLFDFKLVVIVGEAAKLLDQSKIKDKKFERMVPTTKTFNQKAFDEKTSIFTKNLPEQVSEAHLFSTFQAFGTILACQVNVSISKILGFKRQTK